MLRLQLSREARRPLFVAAAVAQLFCELAVSAPSGHAGLWLPALAGGILALPWIAALSGLSASSGSSVSGPLEWAIMLCAAWDGAHLLSALARSACFLTPGHAQYVLTLIPAALTALWAALKNGDSLSCCAALWMRCFPPLMIIVLALQFRFLRPGWLFPILGSGWPSLAALSLQTAGKLITLYGLTLIPGKESASGGQIRPAADVALVSAILAGLLALTAMMSPTPLSGEPNGWFDRLDSVLTNGRTGIYLQLPMIIAWFIGLINALACHCFLASGLLQRAFGQIDGRACVAAVVAGMVALCLTLREGQWTQFDLWRYPLLAALIAQTALIGRGRRAYP